MLREEELRWKGPLPEALWWALKQLWDHSPSPVHLDRLWEAILRRHVAFQSRRQQDLFECWQVLADNEPLRGLFGFARKFRTRCNSREGGCGFAAHAIDRATVWNLTSLDQSGARYMSVEAALQHELEKDVLLPEWRCPCCGGQGGVQRVVERTGPHLLFVQVNRFEQVGSCSAHKVHLACPIPFLGVRTVHQCGGGPPDPVSYDLVGVLLHMGELEGGHYRALCRRDCHWLLFDDTAVQSLGTDPPPGLDREAYGFLLQRVPPPVGPHGPMGRGRGGGARGGGRGRPPPLG